VVSGLNRMKGMRRMDERSRTNTNKDDWRAGCPPPEELELIRTGEGDPALRAHVEHCELCSSTLAGLAALAGELKGATPTAEPVPPHVEKAIMDAYRCEFADGRQAGPGRAMPPSRELSPRGRSRFTRWAMPLAAAASVAVVYITLQQAPVYFDKGAPAPVATLEDRALPSKTLAKERAPAAPAAAEPAAAAPMAESASRAAPPADAGNSILAAYRLALLLEKGEGASADTVAADPNGDGVVDRRDVALLAQLAVSLDEG